MRKQIKDLARKAFGVVGLDVRRGNRWGLDAMQDIRRVIGDGAHAFLDIGANRGQTAAELLRTFPGSTVHCFEPIPLPELREFAAHTPGVNVWQYALGSAEGSAPFTVTEASEGSSLLKLATPGQYGAWTRPASEITVPVRRLDAVWTELNLSRVDLLKTDTQGFDLKVLKGAGDFLSPRTVRMIMAEVNFQTFYDGQSKPHELLEFLDSKGYRPVSLHEGGREKNGRLYWGDMIFA
jgi:FkbM family methyltransferase